MPSGLLIYHITTKQLWEAALLNGNYEAESLAIEGFIHCSTNLQVDGVLDRYFSNKKDLVKLVINTSRLTSPLKFEMAPTVRQEFPHVYGPLNFEAVVEVIYL